MVAVASHDGVRPAVLVRFLRKKCRVNAPKHHPGAFGSGQAPDLVTAKRVARVNPDPDDVARRDRRKIQPFQRFVDDDRIAPRVTRRRGQHIQPSRSDHGDPE
jgi:hypothetical protein